MLKAGFGKSVITPKAGARLMGYANRTAPSTGVHDDLHARAMVLEVDGKTWAIGVAELCYLREPQVAAVREIVQKRTGFPGRCLFLSAIHTHSGPDDQDVGSWDLPLVELIADAVVQAVEHIRPARIGAGSGILYGWSINRRWLDRPVDPFVGVIRVDDEDRQPMGVVANFGCHAVVLGYDNLLMSADWPGVTSQVVEGMLGPGAVCVVTQGGSGDINPLTRQVRARLQSGISIGTMKGKTYYGEMEGTPEWHIGDRGGGTFEELTELGEAVAEEINHVMKTITTKHSVDGLWTTRMSLNGSRQPSDPPYTSNVRTPPSHLIERPNPPGSHRERIMEVMMLGIEELGIVLLGEPGEIFAETAFTMRRQLQTLGYVHPWIISYANGWQVYLPPPSAFPEGGYEVSWAVDLGLSPTLQDRIWSSVHPILQGHVPK